MPLAFARTIQPRFSYIALNHPLSWAIVAAFRGTRIVPRLFVRADRVERIYTWYKEFTAVTDSMSQATLLGICSDNVVTILHPSSTIECFNGNNIVANELIVEGLATFNGGLVINSGPFRIDASGNVDVSGTLLVDDSVNFNGGLVSTNLSASGNVDISGTLGVGGLASFNGGFVSTNLGASGNVDISGTLGVGGLASFNGGLISTSLGTSGNVDISGTLAADGLATFNSGLVSNSDSLRIDASGSVTSAVDIFSNGGTLVPPAGSIIMYAGTTVPTGWLMCDGGLYSRTTYSRLYSVIGITYGGSGSTFNVPDMRSRIPIGAGQGPTLTNYPLGSGGGVEFVTLNPSPANAQAYLALNFIIKW